MTLKIALAQLDIAFAEPDRNFSKIERFVREAADKGCEVVVFPEMWNTGYALTQLADLADKDGSRAQALLSQLACTYAIAIIGGSVSTEQNGRFYNTSYNYDATGRLISRYDKVHLFGLMQENSYLTAGSKENTFEIAGAAAAQLICYDIRFPEWVRTNAARNQAQILFVVAEWPEPRIEQWEILLRARAIENQAFVVAVNRVGADPDNHYNGHSLVIGPLGEILVSAGEIENLTVAEIDLSDMEPIRGQIPVFSDRRPELYY